jgi:hypothetical protein
VGDADARDAEAPEALVDLSLVVDVEVRCSLVHEENFRLPVERPRQQEALLLAA